MSAGVLETVGVWVTILTSVTLLYVIRDRRASIYKSERDAERDDNTSLREKLTTVILERDELLKTRSLEPLLLIVSDLVDQVALSAQLNQATIDKLASFNGSLKHIEKGLRESTEAINLLVGTIPRRISDHTP